MDEQSTRYILYISELRKYEYVKEMKSWQKHTLVHQNKINQNFYSKKK